MPAQVRRLSPAGAESGLSVVRCYRSITAAFPPMSASVILLGEQTCPPAPPHAVRRRAGRQAGLRARDRRATAVVRPSPRSAEFSCQTSPFALCRSCDGRAPRRARELVSWASEITWSTFLDARQPQKRRKANGRVLQEKSAGRRKGRTTAVERRSRARALQKAYSDGIEAVTRVSCSDCSRTGIG